ncbi:hypothetical protein QYE76_065759 [Lolium multiflorum]|uniref:Aminotransferase-like plant mobile domain-containing protein n=1 Tax=Lolium multiflorum TaxID=4521 RepID=A0AAD8S9G9_LOLMU|nr:hypothetical protein QYE76_065759 [Lolium multiflorum]
MNAAALTALVDRWRPETHTFHLRAGEMTPTLQDVSMILGLPIQGEPLCMNTASDGWRGQMEDLIGRAPPPPADPKERTPAGAPFAWIRRTLLDEACRRTGSGGIGGCLLLLSVWSWDRLSVGRPRVLNERPWPHYRDNLDREPTWAYLWDNVSEMTSDPKIMYMHYTEELDTLTAEQRKITNWPVHHRGHVTAFQHCLEAIRNAGHVEIVPHDLAAFNNYLQWFHESTRIELVNHAYDDDILDDPIEFDEVAQSQHDMTARKGRSTSIASSLNFVNTGRKLRRLANLLGYREGLFPLGVVSASVDYEVVYSFYTSGEVWFFIADPICSFWVVVVLLKTIQAI